MELYSEKATVWSEDPEWDDITPIPQVEGEEALASIAYSEDYAMGGFIGPSSVAFPHRWQDNFC